MTTTTRERPILFSSEMVRAILAGTKSVTRRIVKEPDFDVEDGRAHFPSYIDCGDAGENAPVPCPYGAPGDSIWVRERFSPCDKGGGASKIDSAAYVVLVDGTQVYRDGARVPGLPQYAPGAFDGIKWRPSIHMPRWASRITLPVTAVRVERLQDISEADAVAKGVEAMPGGRWRNYMPERESNNNAVASARESFFTLWELINGAASLAANPHVWVVAFSPAQIGGAA